MGIELKIIITGILMLLMLTSGILLSRLGRPLNSLVFTLHKLITVAAIILSALTIYHLQKNIELTNIHIAIFCFIGLVFLSSLISGALLSFEKPVINRIYIVIHKISTVFVLISTTLTICLLQFRN